MKLGPFSRIRPSLSILCPYRVRRRTAAAVRASARARLSPRGAPLLVAALIIVLPAPGRTQGAPVMPVTTSQIPAPIETVPTQTAVAECQTPPKIDGVLDDPCWRNATHAVGFYRYLGTTPIVEQTEAWICADSRHLYVAFHCLDDHPEMIKAMETQRNGDVSNDDTVSIYIDSQNTRRGVSTFTVSASGTQVENLEQGTADNITWAGDWKAACRRVPDGWTAEIEIPWALLHYSRNTREMGILLFRKLARETSQEIWPYMSRDQQQHLITFLPSFDGLAPADYRPRPTFLPYVLATGGQGDSGRFGLDVKYPLTTTSTGVLTLNPDFQDVEQQVSSIAFSYDPIYYGDNRPFFAEGSQYLPYQDVFYSRAIGQIDSGLKVDGKQDGTIFNLLGTTSMEDGGRSDVVANATQEFGKLSDLHVAMAQDSEYGVPGTQVLKTEGQYGWQVGQTQYNITANHMPSWLDGRPADAKDYAAFTTRPPGGQPGYYLALNDIGPNFYNNIGAVPELNIKGADWYVQQVNSFDTGTVDNYVVGVYGSYYDYHTGGFFRKDVQLLSDVDFRPGWNVAYSHTGTERVEYHDHIEEATLNWAEHSLYGKGSVDEQIGWQAGQRYSLLTANQGLGLTRKVALTGTVTQQLLGSQLTTQGVLSGNYRLTFERTIGLRVVTVGHDANVFISFEQKARKGDDIYFLIGNPNSPTTQGLVTLKVVHPF
ncbi:MAG: DUF5916 domain-containing protein [Capsulimonadaceae bacterium]